MLSEKWRKWLVILTIMLCLYCFTWYANVRFRYEPFCKKLGDESKWDTSYLEKDGFTYSVHKPPFFSFTGNLCISQNTVFNYNLSEQTTIDLIIWPCGINDYEIGVGIVETVTDFDEQSSHSYITNMLLDTNMNLLDNTPENRELYEQNLDKIENLYHLAYDMWGILELE